MTQTDLVIHLALKKMGFIQPGNQLSLLCGLVLMLRYPLLSQHGHPDWSAAVEPNTHCVFRHISIRTSINFFSHLSKSNSSVG